jgi:hypothetical protein
MVTVRVDGREQSLPESVAGSIRVGPGADAPGPAGETTDA